MAYVGTRDEHTTPIMIDLDYGSVHDTEISMWGLCVSVILTVFPFIIIASSERFKLFVRVSIIFFVMMIGKDDEGGSWLRYGAFSLLHHLMKLAGHIAPGSARYMNRRAR